MGCCCSFFSNGEAEAAATEARETELAEQQAKKSLVVSAKMSAPTVKIVEDTQLSGHGMALVATALEQDAAYWEWHVTLPARKHVDTILFGVTTKKDRQFYKEQEQGKTNVEEGGLE
jgi:uncharacterized protein YmfQ (DUF2313 family)